MVVVIINEKNYVSSVSTGVSSIIPIQYYTQGNGKLFLQRNIKGNMLPCLLWNSEICKLKRSQRVCRDSETVVHCFQNTWDAL